MTMLLDVGLRPMLHGALGPWDEIISWGTVILVLVVIGAFAFQAWRERDLPDDAETDDEESPL
jgi:hypothetical protein